MSVVTKVDGASVSWCPVGVAGKDGVEFPSYTVPPFLRCRNTAITHTESHQRGWLRQDLLLPGCPGLQRALRYRGGWRGVKARASGCESS